METPYSRNRMSDTVQSFRDSSSRFVGEHVPSATLAAFGLGFAAGLAVVYLMSGNSRQEEERGMAQRLGRQILDAVSHALPESVAKYRHA